jgi:hypothetical protein
VVEGSKVSEQRTRQRKGLFAVLWAGFAVLTLAGGYAMLRACDLGIWPLFGASACTAPVSDTALAAERERQDHLRANLHSAEIRLAQLPICPPPPPPPKPKPVVQPDPPKPEPVKIPDPPPPDPKPEPKKEEPPSEKFEVPKKVEDLKGCWQSVRGDIDIVSDDAEQKPLGKARFCYCFKDNGKGNVLVSYTDGDLCRAPLTAKLKAGTLSMRHGDIPCRTHVPQVGANITCGHDGSEETTCQIKNLGRNAELLSEKFIRVSNEHCGWNG